ncbi:TIGR01440 family protein [Bacillus tianshenii]|nr:TIGR01440 family protein [Bacillus tianshenii]
MKKMRQSLQKALADLHAEAQLSQDYIFVVGCSTSEVAGKHIGSAGTTEVAAELYEVFEEFREQTGVQLAFQCCEHLNRALVVESSTARKQDLDPVAVIPVPSAGGSMAAYAYNHFKEPVMVEHIKADAGIDIGDTLIGMHLKHVAVPIRSEIKEVGFAHITMAKVRPKLIGGARAVYRVTKENESCH